MVFQNCRWIFIGFCLLVITWIASGAALAQTTGQISPDMLAIQGNWIRTDAPYVIELRHAQGGSLQALYFNPKSIHVGKTDAEEQDGFVQLMIELQDINYPGSTYFLRYIRAQDTLQGIYFLPATQQTYEVGFVRKVVK